MDKRGQFYILVAIFLSIVIYALSVRVNNVVISKEPTDFKELSNNYILESNEIINYGLFKRLDIKDDLPDIIRKFTEDFLEYARTKNPNIGLVYIYSIGNPEEGRTVIENHLSSSSISFSTPNTEGALYSSDEKAVNSVTLQIGDDEFSHQVPTKLSGFSSEYYSASLGSSVDALKLDIAGTSFFFNNPNPVDFKIILQTKDEQSGILTPLTITCVTSGGVQCS